MIVIQENQHTWRVMSPPPKGTSPRSLKAGIPDVEVVVKKNVPDVRRRAILREPEKQDDDGKLTVIVLRLKGQVADVCEPYASEAITLVERYIEENPQQQQQ